MDFDLGVLSTRELDTLGKRLHDDGKFGCDYAPMKKPEKMAFIMAEAVRLYGDDSSKLIIELAKGIIAARAEGGTAFDDADNQSECDASAASMEGDDKKEGDQDGQGGEFPGGFGFDASQKPACTDENCCYESGGICPTFPQDGECPECGAAYVNATGHPHTDDGEKCPMEQKLDAHHNGQERPAPNMSMDLVTLIKAVTHDEHDPTFMEVGKALHRAENVTRKIFEIAKHAQKDAESALDLVKESRRKKLIAAPNLTITFPNIPAVGIEGKHPVIFNQLMALFALPDGVRQPVCLYGEAGGGKSTIFEQVAAAFGRFPDDYGAVSCTGMMTEGKTNGRILPIGNGRYIPSDLVRLLLAGKPFFYVWDEFDAAPADIRVGSNTMLAQGAIYIEERSFADEATRIVVPAGACFGAAQNTLNGNDAMYVGRQQQDAAANDRWIMLHMEPDPRVSASILGAPYTPLETWLPQQRTEDELRAELKTAYTWLMQVKKNVRQKSMRRLVTDRASLRARALLTAGFTQDETRNVILAGWTEDEKAMVGVVDGTT